MKLIKNHIPAIAVAITSLYLILLIYPLVQRGMFLDGVIYAAVAKNIALGIGSVWKPFYSHTLFPEFYEHPAFAMVLQSFFFKLFGNGFFVERFYCLVTALGQIILVSYLWHKQQKSHPAIVLLLLLLWILIPLNTSTYKNNMLEMTATLFSTFAVSILIFNKQQHWFKHLFTLFSCAFCIFLAVLSNGPTSVFVFIVPFLQTLIYKKNTYLEALKTTLLLIFFSIMSAVIFFTLQDGAKYNFMQYLQHQFLASITGERGSFYTGLHHLFIFDLFFKAYWPISFIALLIASLHFKTKGYKITLLKCISSKHAQFYFLLALCSSLPVGLSPRQSFHYITQSAPFYLLAIMHFLQPIYPSLIERLTMKKQKSPIYFMSSLSLCVCCFIFVGSHIGHYSKHQEMIEDVNKLTLYLKPHSIIDVTSNIYNEWDLGAYFSRQGLLSASNTKNHKYLITLKTQGQPHNYTPVAIDLEKYKLWKKA